MLKNGLGALLLSQAETANRVFDPFCGSAAVTWFIAQKTSKTVFAGDLQKYSVDLANSVLLRTAPLSQVQHRKITLCISEAKKNYFYLYNKTHLTQSVECVDYNIKLSINSPFNITRAYGGYYLSYNQAIMIDMLLNNLPDDEDLKSIMLSAIIEATSQCVAAPGHTAQPFKPRNKGLKAIMEAWRRDPIIYTERAINKLSLIHAKQVGEASITDANHLLKNLEENDLVFLDPPYSGVHYSRFYHVLESVARNEPIEVSGTGRYPSPSHRPKSDFSLRSKSSDAIENIFATISERKAKAIITYPAEGTSNGLSGLGIKEIARKYFNVKKELVKGRFSTLGGNNLNRPARLLSTELILLLE
ncbi:adenine methyltransferase [Spirosoma taeanense]|uniref:site-specific DNA-methyltransferase (adenine-specific) n=2 Tax=Spirosoma taeanense TaxID=2735870 RepID=A0A6M5YE46_9BACT|nr:adenine methyltransferase [Spirosoma taeanense]